MSDYDFKPSGGLKLKGVKDKKIKKSKKDKPKKDPSPEKETKEEEPFVLQKTEAERRFDEIQRQRLDKKIEKNAVKSHRERVDEMNKFLDSLSDHHDMPKVGPG